VEVILTEDVDKSGQALEQQRFQMLQDIASDLSREVVFPCHFDLVLHLRKTLRSPRLAEDEMVQLLSLDPLLSARLVGLANAPDFGPLAGPVCDLPTAVARMGFPWTRMMARKLVAQQFLQGAEVAVFGDLLFGFWRHSLKTASAAVVVNRHFGRFSEAEAMFLGLVHDIGAFYMLYKAAQYEELRKRPESVKFLIAKWHDGLGHALLGALGVPARLVEAVRDHDSLRPPAAAINNRSDLVYVANALSGAVVEWKYMDSGINEDTPVTDLSLGGLDPCFAKLGDEIRGQFDAYLARLSSA
jgi:HD-like signal output (HDOD) protein